jgi:cytochrome c oxidase subunit 2
MIWTMLAQTVSSDGSGFWMPPRASTVSGDVDGLFHFVLWITVIFSVLIGALMIAFVIKYRHRPGRDKADPAPAHNTALELTWTVVPTVIVLMVFYFGFRGFLDMSVAPPDSYEIVVTAKMWNWSFTYPNGHTTNELHVPVDVPVRIVLQSSDVIHSLYIPQFRVKKDAVPGRFNRFWFQATQQGVFDVYCAEYCGQQHSKMLATVVVHDLDGFKRWLEEDSNWESRLSPTQGGEMLVQRGGCLQCHSLDGTTKNGPTLKDLFGRQETMRDGSTSLVDENYIVESIYDPNAKIVQGFNPQMPSYRGRYNDRDVNAIIAYLKSISVHARSSLPATAPATGTSMPPTTN